MPAYRSFCRTSLAATSLLLAAGCGGLKPPSVDPVAAAARALELYDADGSGALEESEWDSCPPLKAAVSEYDLDASKSVTPEEIVERLESMYGSGVALTMSDCKIRLNGRPLPGATVRYVPDPMLGEATATAEGTTDQLGVASVAMPDEELPEEQRGRRRLQVGLYRVEVTHPQAEIPPQYNTDTVLGFELHPYSHDGSDSSFDLRTSPFKKR